jgi:hypothetical protein
MRIVIVVAAAVAGIACASATAAQRVYVLQGGSPYGHSHKPRRLAVAGDGSFFVTSVRWGSYSSTRATGRGMGHVNDCVPDCAGGTLHRVRVRVRLSAPRTCANGSRYFTHQRVTFLGHRPLGLPRRESFNAASC